MTAPEETKPNRIAEWRKRRGMTQQQLADRIGVHWITISKLERGKMKLTTDRLRDLAMPLGVEPKDLLENFSLLFQVWVSGHIVNGQTVRPFEENVLESIITEDDDEVSSISNDWLKVVGTDLEPFYYDGDMIRVTYYSDEATPFMLGRLARLTLADKRILFAVLDRHIEGDRYDVRTAKGMIYADVEVLIVAVITGHLVRLIEDPTKIAKTAI